MTHARVPRRKSVAVAQPGFNFNAPDEIVCGVDEAGRGPLAGPVVAAAVIFDPSKPMIRGLDDSKALTAKKRDELYDKIVERALAYCVASASVEEIDTLNILHATMLAMKRAVEGLTGDPGHGDDMVGLAVAEYGRVAPQHACVNRGDQAAAVLNRAG